MHIFKGLSCLAFVVLYSVQPAYAALKPPLKDRAFYQQKGKAGGGGTFANPWIDIESIEIAPENKRALELRDWLLRHQSALEAWPPRYTDDKEVTALIKDWQKMSKRVEKWQASLKESPELGSLAVTFWFYGHNLDEDNAAHSAFELVDELNAKFGSHPLPVMMKGMLKSGFAGKGSHDLLKEARTRTQDKALLGLIDLAIAQQCAVSFKPHQSLYALNEAVDECPDCMRRYRGLALAISGISGSRPNIGLQNPYYMIQENDNHVVGSIFYGFEAALPSGWKVDGISPYEPENPMGAFMFNAPPLPDSGLIHGVMFFTALADSGHPKDPGAIFLGLFSKPRQGAVKVSSIRPLLKNPRLTHWYRLDTEDPVGKNDTITMIAASGILRPQTWTIADHHRLARDEGECERPESEPGKMEIFRKNARVEAPVEFTVNYSASKASYAEAEKKMKEIVATLKFDSYAFSEVEAKLAKELK